MIGKEKSHQELKSMVQNVERNYNSTIISNSVTIVPIVKILRFSSNQFSKILICKLLVYNLHLDTEFLATLKHVQNKSSILVKKRTLLLLNFPLLKHNSLISKWSWLVIKYLIMTNSKQKLQSQSTSRIL